MGEDALQRVHNTLFSLTSPDSPRSDIDQSSIMSGIELGIDLIKTKEQLTKASDKEEIKILEARQQAITDKYQHNLSWYEENKLDGYKTGYNTVVSAYEELTPLGYSVHQILVVKSDQPSTGKIVRA